MTQVQQIPLAEQLANAPSLSALNALIEMTQGPEFRFASQRTRNRWRRIAERRKVELQGKGAQ